jgi:GNAT superfamily N-acetyltransferase
VTEITSYAGAATAAAINNEAALAMRRHVRQQPGGLATFRRRLHIESIGTPAAGSLDEYYAVLRSSILPDELVPLADFTAALGPKNIDPILKDAIGPYRYYALALRAPGYGTIGAAGFAAFCHRRGPATMHASYYALLPAFRRLGLGRLLIDAATETTIRFVVTARPTALDAGSVVQFIEVNDIADMTLRDRLLDEAIAMHPLARDAMWEDLNFREVMTVKYRQRDIPLLPLALKAVLVDVAPIRNTSRVRALRAPAAILSDIVSSHVAAFDNFLMNYDESRRILGRGGPLPDPTSAGLLARVAPNTDLPVRSLEQALQYRQKWQAIDRRLSRRPNLPLDAKMQALRDEVEHAR